MKIFCIILISINISIAFCQNPYKNFDYVDPIPESKYINSAATIILRPKPDININSINNSGAVKIYSNNTTENSFSYKICDSGKVIIFKTLNEFHSGDSIYLYFTDLILKKDGTSIEPFSYRFFVTGNDVKKDLFQKFDISICNENIQTPIQKPTMTAGSIPNLTVTYKNNPSPGKIFLNNLTRLPDPGNSPSLMIADNDGKLFFVKEMPEECYDLNIQPNGLLTYFDGSKNKYYALNNNYDIVDSFYCGNGYTTDLHELKILSNGHSLLMSYDTRVFTLIGGGSLTNTNVVGIIIQELDENKNVIFQFRSWDHFLITDATHENLTALSIDYCHSNAIELDNDGNLLISSRNMDEITKISRLTGRIIWRLGGKNNQFTFINDPDGFSHQHAVRRIKNGNITLFDNGNFHVPPYSRAVEYKLDEVNKTATLVWQYRNSPDIFAPATGYVQRLENNNTFICWGLTNPTLCEVRYDGTKVLEMTFPQGVFSYRAYKYPWRELPNNEILPSVFSLLQNYPNPFNPKTNIKFTIPRLPSEVSIENIRINVYDLTGKLVKELLNDNFSSGTYSVKFDGSFISSGVYFYKLEAFPVTGDGLRFTETKKMVLIK